MSSYICYVTRQKQLTPREITSADWILRHIIIHSIIPCIHSVTCTAVRLEALALSRALDYNRIQSKSSRKVLVASSLSLKKKTNRHKLTSKCPLFLRMCAKRGKRPFHIVFNASRRRTLRQARRWWLYVWTDVRDEADEHIIKNPPFFQLLSHLS